MAALSEVWGRRLDRRNPPRAAGHTKEEDPVNQELSVLENKVNDEEQSTG